MSAPTIATHGAMEGGGSYNLHAKIPADGGSLALPYLERAAQGDPTEMRFDEDFDAVVGHLILVYYSDPVDALRKLLLDLRPGGIVAFQEVDSSGCKSHPISPTDQRCLEWIMQTFRGTGAQATIGLELHSIFRSAGLPAPALRLDAAVGAGPDTPYKMLPEIVRSLLPAMERLGIATAAEVEVESLGHRIRDEILADNGIVISPSLIRAWTTNKTAPIKRNDKGATQISE
jgi:SAM-dependent methyltransferase